MASQLGSHSLDGFVLGKGGGALVSGWKHALIMDEVDGMAGNEDRGGMQVRMGETGGAWVGSM